MANGKYVGKRFPVQLCGAKVEPEKGLQLCANFGTMPRE